MKGSMVGECLEEAKSSSDDDSECLSYFAPIYSKWIYTGIKAFSSFE
ncbi:MAG: hypothetical protein ACRCVG_06850 [Methanobacteriaceae archaeon]